MKEQTTQKMDELISLMERMEDLRADMDGLRLEIHEKANELKEYDKTFAASMAKIPYKGTFYSIRSKYNPDLKQRIAFVCSGKRAFGSWLKKEKVTPTDTISEAQQEKLDLLQESSESEI